MTQTDIIADGLMRVTEVAEFLSVSRPTVYKLMANGQLPFTRIGDGGQRRIPRKAVDRFAIRNLSVGNDSGNEV